MTRAFDLALHQAKNMSRPRPPSITIGIDFSQSSMPMAGGGGLSSVQKRMNIGGEPHRLSYINSDEASLLKQLGGSGRPVNGVPAYFGVGYSDEDAGYSDPADVAAGHEAATSGEGYMGTGPGYGTVDDPEIGTGIESITMQQALENKGGLFGLGIVTPENVTNVIGSVLGGALGTAVGGPGLGALGAYKGGDYLNEFIDYLSTLPAPDKGKGDLDDPDDTPTEEDEEEKKIIAEEEKKEEKKLRGMAAYFAKMGGVSPLGYTDSEIELFKRIYPPDHPIWEDINREREPMWPSIEDAVV